MNIKHIFKGIFKVKWKARAEKSLLFLHFTFLFFDCLRLIPNFYLNNSTFTYK